MTEFQRERSFFNFHYAVFFFSGSFVSDVVHIYYTSDEKLQEDVEIQAFIKDVCSFGMQDFDFCGGCTLQTFYCIILLLALQQQSKCN